MASTLAPIYDIMPDNCAYSSTGERDIKFLSACVAVVVVFVDKTIMIEHRTDAELCVKGDMGEAFVLLETEMSMAARQRQNFKKITAAAAGILKVIAVAVDFLKIHRVSGSIFFEDIEKVHEFDRILVFTSETL
jgi:hypothetical protein